MNPIEPTELKKKKKKKPHRGHGRMPPTVLMAKKLRPARSEVEAVPRAEVDRLLASGWSTVKRQAYRRLPK
jgi:hypothetical protein